MSASRYFAVLLILLLITPLISDQEWRTCTRIIDGDTIVLDGNETVRLIGVDCPELNEQASGLGITAEDSLAFVSALAKGRKVRLEYDNNRVDKYGRTLAYIYLEDGLFLNAQIILQGYGTAYTVFPFKYIAIFQSYEKMAKARRLGLWSQPNTAQPVRSNLLSSPKTADSAAGNVTVYITKTGSKYHRAGCRSLSRSSIPISLKDAKARGFAPCSICKPPN